MSSENYDTRIARQNNISQEDSWLAMAAGITAGAIVLFEIIPMSSILVIDMIIRQQQEEHIIYPTMTASPNIKPENEHNVAIPSHGLFLLSHRESTNFKSEENIARTKKLLHRTFRIPEDVVEDLEKQARSGGIPLSNLVNKILKDYLSAELQPEKTGFILISKDFFRKVFSMLEEKSIEYYGKELSQAIVSEYTSSFFPEINSFTVIQFLESWFKRFQSYQHRIDKENNRHSFSVNHDINMNFSIVLKVILEGLVEPITKSKLIFGGLTPSSITFTFDI